VAHIRVAREVRGIVGVVDGEDFEDPPELAGASE
jgi:hypothetical protein